MKNILFKNFWPAIVWFFVVLILLCIPGSDLPKSDAWYTKIYLDKWVHIGLFGILAFLWMWPFVRSSVSSTKNYYYIILIAILTSVWGLATEFIQKNFIPNREFDWWDWVADSVGAILAVIVSSKKS